MSVLVVLHKKARAREDSRALSSVNTPFDCLATRRRCFARSAQHLWSRSIICVSTRHCLACALWAQASREEDCGEHCERGRTTAPPPSFALVALVSGRPRQAHAQRERATEPKWKLSILTGADLCAIKCSRTRWFDLAPSTHEGSRSRRASETKSCEADDGRDWTPSR